MSPSFGFNDGLSAVHSLQKRNHLGQEIPISSAQSELFIDKSINYAKLGGAKKTIFKT
jgi:hypothetical protein